MADPTFWDNPQTAREVIADANELKSWLEPHQELLDKANELDELATLLEAEADPSLEEELNAEIARLEQGIEKLELRTMLRGADDGRDAILNIHPGAGGTESQDWAEMLLRMYTRYAEQHNYDVVIHDLQPGEEAGIKNATLEIKGKYAYGYLKAERGVHRLVRISPFDSQSRRHTSFASVFVYPVVDETIEIVIDEKDLRIDTYRAGGKGGQNVNKVETAVRITHRPSGVVVACQAERTQGKNKDLAMGMLKAKLYQLELDRKKAEAERTYGEKSEIAWGSQIRSYVFQPYQMVKDHRTGVKTGNITAVMDGDLDPFIEAQLRGVTGDAGADDDV